MSGYLGTKYYLWFFRATAILGRMHLPHPQTLHDVVIDGLLEQASVDADFHSVTGAEFSGLAPSTEEPDVPVEVRLYPSGSTQTGTRVARVADGTWTWLTSHTSAFPIPELHGEQPASDQLLRAARTLSGNAPGVLVPHGDGTSSVVVLTPAVPAPLDRVLLAGLPAPRRAVASLAASRGLQTRETPEAIEFENGPRVLLSGDEAVDIDSGLRLADLRADAALVSAEHQLLFDGLFPDAHFRLDVASATVQITSAHRSLVSGAQVLATVEQGQWLWAWADQRISHSPAARASAAVRDFGLTHALPLFTAGALSADLAHRQGLIDAAKAALGRWTHALIPLPGATAVVLLEHDQLHLPPATEAAIAATLRAPVDPTLNLYRAVGAYANFRGLQIRGEDLFAPDTRRALHVRVEDGKISSAPRGIPGDPGPR